MTLLRTLALAGLVALAAAGCTSTDMNSGGFETADQAVESMPPNYSGDMASEEMGVDAQNSAPGSQGADTIERSQIITGDLYLTADDPLVTADAVEAEVTAAGGRVDSRSESAEIDGQTPRAYLWVRIPTEELEDTLDAIEALGVVESKTLSNQDVTLQVVDLDARIAVLEESISRLQELLTQAATTADIVEIETALSERQGELDSLNSQRNYLSDQVQYASIGVDIRSPEVAPERDPDGFVDGIVTGWQAMLAFFAGTIVFFGVIVPWVGLLVALGLVIWLIARLRRKNTTRRGEE
ncbi:DUF4349-like protein [Pontimonas salivibrio]|uniref:DUF4349-like protein n=1 Tax=Pontimonas salivibrio TaxID=1159327 RepID=A0A2L2BPA5_9MICO|nr:DUF4349 domain-containing protein [Pontimonas salivibrio]AVG23478.1 DUF4349-like protein [Pontimonas salivibrio]